MEHGSGFTAFFALVPITESSATRQELFEIINLLKFFRILCFLFSVSIFHFPVTETFETKLSGTKKTNKQTSICLGMQDFLKMTITSFTQFPLTAF